MRSRKADNSGMSDVETRNVTLDNDDDDDGCYGYVHDGCYACVLARVVLLCRYACTCSWPVGKRVYWLIASFLPSARLPIGSTINRYAPATCPLDIRPKAFRSTSLCIVYVTVYICIYIYVDRWNILNESSSFSKWTRIRDGPISRNRCCFVARIIISGRINRSLSASVYETGQFWHRPRPPR